MITEELDQLEYLIIGNILNNPDHLQNIAVTPEYFEDGGCYNLLEELLRLWSAKEPIILVEIADKLGMSLEVLCDLSQHPATKKLFIERVGKLRKAYLMRFNIRRHITGAIDALIEGTRPEYVGKALITNLTKELG